MKPEKIHFENRKGEKLAARLEFPPDSKPYAFALFAHCFTCNKNLTAVRNISRALSGNGIAVLRFDFTGLGESEGDFADTNFSSNVEDLVDAANFLAEHYEAPGLLVGHSLGGAAVLKAGLSLPSVKAITTIGAPYDPEHVTHLFSEDIEAIKSDGVAKVSIGGREFTIKKSFLEDIEETKTLSTIHALERPLLIMHSPVDQTVEVSNATSIYKAAQHPKSFVSLDQADHLLSRKEDSLYAGEMIASWVKRYLPAPDPVKLQTDGQVVVLTEEDSYTTMIKAGSHHLIADEPETVGGSNFGPTPYDLLTSALGACTSMTLRMYADRKKWPLKRVKVHLEHEKDYAKDCENCEQSSAKIDHFYRKIELEGDLDDTQRARLLEIADKCPVHKTLHNEVKVITKEV